MRLNIFSLSPCMTTVHLLAFLGFGINQLKPAALAFIQLSCSPSSLDLCSQLTPAVSLTQRVTKLENGDL